MKTSKSLESLTLAIAFLQRHVTDQGISIALAEKTAKHLHDFLGLEHNKAHALAWQAVHIVEQEYEVIISSLEVA